MKTKRPMRRRHESHVDIYKWANNAIKQLPESPETTYVYYLDPVFALRIQYEEGFYPDEYELSKGDMLPVVAVTLRDTSYFLSDWYFMTETDCSIDRPKDVWGAVHYAIGCWMSMRNNWRKEIAREFDEDFVEKYYGKEDL
jgi:hypothetical protein